MRGNGAPRRVRSTAIVVLALVVCSSGALATEVSSTPPRKVEQKDASTWDFTIIKEIGWPEVAWHDVVITLTDREGEVTRQTWTWSIPYPSGLETQSRVTASLAAGANPTMFCNVTDLTGNGYVDNGDFFSIRANTSDFDKTSVDELAMIYTLTADSMWTGELHDGKLVRPSEFSWLLMGSAVVISISVVVVLVLLRSRKGKVNGKGLAPVQEHH